MSSFGLEVRNHQGFSSLDPDSFTVKLVESVWVGWSILDPDTVIDIPTSVNVMYGMFAAICPYNQLTAVRDPDMQMYFAAGGYPLSLPIVEIYNGFIRVRGQPLYQSRSTGMIVVNIMSYR